MSVPQIISRLGRFDKAKLAGLLSTLSMSDAQALLDYWPLWAMPHQQMPEGNWRRWNKRVGRGGGKTYGGAKWTNTLAEDRSKIRTGEIMLVAKTYSNVRNTMIEDPGSGILATAKPSFRPRWEPGKGILTWPNGVRGRVVTAEDPDTGRGINAAFAWLDELMAWPNPDYMYWDIIEPALRIGWARCIITSTPKPSQFLRDLEALDDTVVTRGSTFDNPHLSDHVKDALRKNFEGTRRGLQELYGEILEDDDRFLWRLDTIANNRVRNRPQLVRIVVAIDPAVTAKDSSDYTGIIVAGIDANGEVFVLQDATMKGAPHEWAQQAIDLFKIYRADRIVAEVNQGGDMVEATLRAIDPSVPYKSVRATRGKLLRAEPVAALYEQDRVHHVGVFAELEEQQCTWMPGKPSPDRLDALVWAVTELALEDEANAGSILAYL